MKFSTSYGEEKMRDNGVRRRSGGLQRLKSVLLPAKQSRAEIKVRFGSTKMRKMRKMRRMRKIRKMRIDSKAHLNT